MGGAGLQSWLQSGMFEQLRAARRASRCSTARTFRMSGAVGEQFPVVEFAVVEQDMRVRGRRDGEVPRADELPDLRP